MNLCQTPPPAVGVQHYLSSEESSLSPFISPLHLHYPQEVRKDPKYDVPCRDGLGYCQSDNDRLFRSARNEEAGRQNIPTVSQARDTHDEHHHQHVYCTFQKQKESHSKIEGEWNDYHPYSQLTQKSAEPDIARTIINNAVEAFHEEQLRREQTVVDRLQELQKELFSQTKSNEELRREVRSQKERAELSDKENVILQRQLDVVREQLASVGDLCFRRGQAMVEAGLPLALMCPRQVAEEPLSVAAEPRDCAGGEALEERGKQVGLRTINESGRSGHSPIRGGGSNKKNKCGPNTTLSLRTVTIQPPGGSEGCAASPSYLPHSAVYTASPWSVFPRALELPDALQIPHEWKPISHHDQTASHQLHCLLGNPWSMTTSNNNNNSISMINRSAKSDGPSFDYNDLVPLKGKDLDPQLLAALHPSFVPQPVAQNPEFSVPGSPMTQCSPRASPTSGSFHLPVFPLNEEIQWLKHQMEVQKKENERDNERRDNDAYHQHLKFVKERESWSKAVRKLEEVNACCVQDLIKCQQTYGRKLQATEADLSDVRKRLGEAIRCAEKAQREKNKTVLQAENAVTERFKQRLSDLKLQIMRKTEQWDAERRQLLHLVDEQQQRVKAMEAELVNLRAKLKKEKARFQLGKDGSKNELQLMRQSVRKLEKKLLLGKALEHATPSQDLEILKHYMA